MRLPLLLASLCALFALSLAWTKEDHEIFDLVSAIESAEGKGTTFYSWLDVSPKATAADISRAYRKKSMVLHPDKNPGVKGIQARFARLGVVAAILREPEARKRYDFFFKNGVPRWRGTGYYYSRYRPGLTSVLVFLTLLTSGLQYLVQKLNYRKDVERIDRFVKKARTAAWGPNMTRQAGAKKVRIQISDDPGCCDDRAIDMLVEGEHVYLLGDDEPVSLDAGVATKPALTNTWAVSLVRSLLMKVIPGSKADSDSAAKKEESDDDDVSDAAETSEGGTSGTGKTGASRAATMAGGRRRKVAPKKK